MNFNKKNKGFTLIEMAVIILVIAILAVVLIISMNTQAQKANEAGVEVDMHSFYVAAKGTILSGIDGKLDSKEAFVNELNTFLDPAMSIKSDMVYSNEIDPWKQSYEFRWRSREVAGRTEHWVAFLSQGVGLRDGWIFEPDNPNNSRYDRKGIDCNQYDEEGNKVKEFRYITVLGYYDGGVIIPELPNPETDIPWIIGNDIAPDPATEQWAFLTFDIEDDGIEFDTTKLTEDQNIASISQDEKEQLGGTSGYSNRKPTGGYIDRHYNEYSGSRGLYTLLEKIGSTPNLPTMSDGTIGYARYETVNSVPESIASDGDLDNYFKNQGWIWTHTTEDDPESGERYIVSDIAVGNGNIIRLRYKEADKRAENSWFKVGSTVKLTAIPGPKYDFEYWKVNGTKDSENKTISIVVNADTSFTAKFKMNLSISGGKLVTSDGTNISDYIAAEEANKANIINNAAASQWTYTLNEDDTATLTEFTGSAGSALNIPSTVDGHVVSKVTGTSLQSKSFTSINIPANVTVDNGAFSSVTANSVSIGDGCVLVSNAFRGANISSLNIGSSVTPNNTSSYRPFSNATITSITTDTDITAGVTNDYGITSSTGLVNLVMTDNVTTMNAGLQDFTTLESVRLSNNITSLPLYAFKGASNLRTINIPSGITNIGDRAFYGCSSLPLNFDNINLSNVSSIGEYAFNGIIISGSITIPDNTTIGQYAFKSTNTTSSINNLTIGNGSTIGAYAFQDLKISGNVTIGQNCTVNSNSFNQANADAPSISNMIIGENTEIKGKFLSGAKITKFVVNSGANLNKLSLNDCTINELKIESGVTLPSGTTSSYLTKGSTIDKLDCDSIPTAYCFYNSTLQEVKIGEAPASINSYAFMGSTLMTKLYIGEGVTNINQYAFSGCTSLDDVTINNSEGSVSINSSAFKNVPAYTNGTINYLK